MLIVGAKGFAKEVLEVLYQLNDIENVVFYDDVSRDLPKQLFERFDILRNVEEVEKYFKNVDNRFTIGIGGPVLRKKMYDKFTTLGGAFTSTISPKANIGHYGTKISKGSNILNGAIVSNDVSIKMGTIVYFNTIITHDCLVGKFVELSPGAKLLGRVKIGDYSQIGASATILPNITIGENVIVGAGSVVTQNVQDNCLVVGVPAKIIRELPSISF